MSKGIFITATGTDVGKTFVSALLLKKMRDAGKNAGYYKAALSGAERINGSLDPGDCSYVANFCGMEERPESLVSYMFEAAVSPHLAALLQDKSIKMEVLCRDFERVKKNYDYFIMEGSGGIICPLRYDQKHIFLTDLILQFGLDLIIVALSGLGTLNHTLLTVEYARKLGIGIKGIILNHFEVDHYLHQDNKKMIEDLTGLPILACLRTGADDCDIPEDTLIALFDH